MSGPYFAYSQTKMAKFREVHKLYQKQTIYLFAFVTTGMDDIEDSLMMGTDCLLAGHAFCVTVLALVKKHGYGLIVLVKKYSPGTS